MSAGDGAPAIPRVADGPLTPAAPQQQRLWILQGVDGESSAYNLALALRCNRAWDRAALVQALTGLAERHEALRTSLMERDGQVLQHVRPPEPFPLTEARAGEEGMAASLQALMELPFDFAGGGPLVRAQLVHAAGESSELLLGFHHAIVDGASITPILHELTQLYAAALAQRPPALPPLPLRYRDIAAWQADPARRAERAPQHAHWLRRLQGMTGALDLPRRPGPVDAGARAETVTLVLAPELHAGVQDFARAHGTTPFVVWLAAYAVLLGRFGATTDVAVGVPASVRKRGLTDTMIGFLVDTLVLRCDLQGPVGFAALVERLRDASREDFRQRDMPLGELMQLLRPHRQAAGAPLFQAAFNLLQVPTLREEADGIVVEARMLLPRVSRFDVGLDLHEVRDRIEARFEARGGMFDRATAEAMASAYPVLLEAALADPDRRIDTLPLQAPAAAARWLQAVHAGAGAQAPSTTLHAAFVDRARRHPEAIALLDGARAVRYGELERQSAALAAQLRALGVDREQPVAVLLERSPALVAAVLGVLRSGGAFVALDPAHPPQRLAFILADSGAKVLVAQQPPDWLPAGVQWLAPDTAPPAEAPPDTASADSLAYLVYTSGSTGQPKGVLGLHRGAVNRIRWMEQAFPWQPGEVACQKTTVAFVDAIWELFGPLLGGVPSALVPAAAVRDPGLLAQVLAQHGVTRLVLVPSLLRALLELPAPARPLASLRLCVSSGEALPAALAGQFAQALPHCRLLNLYGSAEVAADATWHLVDPQAAGPVPIGRPIAGNRILLLDAAGQLLPPGVPGEIHVGGAGLARGYHGQPALTAERFLPDPASPGERLFRTGDLGRWQADGSLLYLGRADRQVKIRGVRVEPEEVQAVLARHPGVREAVVVARQLPSGEPGLVAYVVARGPADAASWRRHALECLPQGLVPAAFVALDALPLNTSGKIALDALPDPASVDDAGSPLSAEPANAAEAVVAGICSGLLGRALDAHTDFFAAGGDSLLAIRAMARINEAFGTRLPVAALFDAATPHALARRLQAAAAGRVELPPVTVAPRPPRLPLSFNQLQLWLVERTQGPGRYNLPNAYRLRGALRPELLEQALRAVALQHEALRTRIVEGEGEPVQVVDAQPAWQLERHDARDWSAARLQERLAAAARHPFSLADEQPLRASLWRVDEKEWLLLLVLHHAACDGTSGVLLVRDIAAAYRAALDGAAAVSAPALQAADWALWQREAAASGALAPLVAQWQRELEGAPTLLNLPPATGDAPADSAARVTLQLEPALVAGLTQLARRSGTTLHMTLMAAWGALLARYTGQDEVLVGTPAAAREPQALEATVGFLANTLALRIDLRGQPDFLGLLARVRSRMLAALGHQQVPLPLVVEAVQPVRVAGRPPLVQAMFVLQDPRGWQLDLPGVEAQQLELDVAFARHDLALVVTQQAQGMQLALEYACAQVDAALAQRMADALQALLQAVCAQPATPLAQLAWLGAQEQALLAGWEADPVPPQPDRVLLHELLALQAQRQPQAIAVAWRDQAMSYAELQRLTEACARRLLRAGVQPGDRVGLVAERCPGLIVALAGILRAGAAYVPVDPAYPPARIAGMLADAGVRAVVADRALGELDALRLPLDPWLGLAVEEAEPAGDLPAGFPTDAVACVVFTSGSTGRPKGALLRHAALCGAAACLARHFGLQPGDRLLQVVALGFDVASADIAMTWASGATLCLEPAAELLPGRTLHDTLVRTGATHAQLPPSLLALTPVPARGPLRLVVTGGEPCPAEVAQRWAAGRRMLLAYGPTETTVLASQVEYRPGLAPACIGRPVAGARLYVLDADGARAPVGVAGELFIGGAGVALGYLAQPELTAQRFLPDPRSSEPGARCYRSGDLVRWREDGQLEFLGRVDRQLKLRGLRIEPGEIEACLEQAPGVARALVGVRDEAAGDRSLWAFVLAQEGVAPDLAALRAWVRGRLPAHMVPARFQQIDAVPLTPHGKTDWQALLALQPAVAAAPPAGADLSAVQQRVAAIWREVLERDAIGLDENFFDAGGHSLRLVRVHAALESAFACRLPIGELFALPTIRATAARLAGQGAVLPAAGSGPGAGAPIAIIGMAGRFPGAADLDAFWELLAQGREGLTHGEGASADGWVASGGLVPDADLFDPAFFGLSPREAERMDPQQRVLLECAWQAMEDAGYDPARAGGPVGVFAGAGASSYLQAVLHPDGQLPGGSAGYQLMTANEKDFVATQLAYRLDLRGPAIGVQTACSTALVAVALAAEALRAGRCRMALAGGVSIRFPQQPGYPYEPGMILSPDGHCRPFAADAAGTVPAGGAGLVLLKPLAQAQADGDRILAVLRGVGLGNDGAGKVGFSAPGVEGQAAAIAAAVADAGLMPADIDYVEAHGTGTGLGDPAEVAALARVFGGRSRPLALGSVKSNIGHADTAAGAAGLIKAVLALHHGLLPASLHAGRPNPRIPFDAGPFEVLATARPWPRSERVRRAGVSAFGIGGTNAHVVLEEAPPAPHSTPDEAAPQLLLVSARTPAARDAALQRLATHLRAHPSLPLADVAYTLRAGRAVFPHRAAVVAGAAAAVPGEPAAWSCGEAVAPATALLFPGQGSQSPRMGEALYRSDAHYRAAFDECARILQPLLGADLRRLLYGPEGEAADAAALRRTELAQPVLFTVGYALAKRWRALALAPQGLLGHSIGEYVAATLAGVFSLEDALALVAERGRLVAQLPPGAMLALPLPQAEAQVLLQHAQEVSIAALNAPRQTVVAGPPEAIAALAARLQSQGVAATRLATSHAFHCALLDPVLPAFEARVRALRLQPPRERFVSNVTGRWITPQEATDPAYWVRHLREPVRFAEGVQTLQEAGIGLLLEAGGGTLLGALALAAGWRGEVQSSLPQGATDPGLQALGRLWALGLVQVPDGAGRRVPLPTYPFERQRCWPQAAPKAAALPAKHGGTDQWLYRVAWTEAPPPAAGALEASGPWLLLLDEGGVGAALAQALAGRGAVVHAVAPGHGFEDYGDGRFVLPPADAGAYRQLLAALPTPPRRIVHLWGLDEREPQERGFHSLLALAQALGAAGVPPQLRIDVVTRGVAEVTGDEALRPEAALALGAVKVLPLELPPLRMRAIDIAPGAPLAPLLAELATEDEAPLTALRGRRRWQQEIRPARLPASGRDRWRRGGTYLVTGGFGGMGAAIARALARDLGARLALLGRQPLPPAAEWDARAQGDDAVGGRIRLVRELEALGADVLPLAADLGDAQAVAAALATVRERWGPLHGVIHAAGLADLAGVVQARTRAQTEAVLAPKVAGTLALDRLLADGPLDFMLLCSSLSSVLSGAKFGQVGYAAANEFLDLFAAERQARTGQFTQALDWDDWAEAGMTVAAHRRWGIAAPAADEALTSDEGVAVLRRALATDYTRLAVSVRDLPALVARGPALRDELARHVAPAAPAPAAIEATGGSTLELLAAHWRALLGVEQLDAGSHFFELGGHSLLGMQVIGFVRQRLGVELGLAALFEAPTLGALAARVDALRGGPAGAEEEFLL